MPLQERIVVSRDEFLLEKRLIDYAPGCGDPTVSPDAGRIGHSSIKLTRHLHN